MGPRLAILLSAGAIALLPGLPARAAEKASISYPSQPAVKAAQPTTIQERRSVLEMVAERLNLFDYQKIELKNLLQAQQDQLAALHQDLNSSDAQKSTKFLRIRRQTKDSFVALLTPEQRSEFNRLMGR